MTGAGALLLNVMLSAAQRSRSISYPDLCVTSVVNRNGSLITTSLFYRQVPIDRQVGKNFAVLIGPAHFERIDPLDAPQPKVQAAVFAGEKNCCRR